MKNWKFWKRIAADQIHSGGEGDLSKINYMLYQLDRLPIRTYSKNLACGAFCVISLACSAFFSLKNLACGACFS